MLRDGQEIALLDLREEGDFTQGHLLLAASLPIGRLALDLAWRVPRRSTRTVLVGGGEDRMRHALDLLQSCGYSNVCVLQASREQCERAGLGWFRGKFVPSKAFGEVVQTSKRTPHIPVAQLVHLAAHNAERAKLLMVDCRTPEEFEDFSLPDAVNCPGAELVLRVPEHVDPDTVVLVNCAGRTRSIIGTQSLINAGLPNPVYAVENGTMGWCLDGHALRRGVHAPLERAATSSFAPLARSHAAALQLLHRTGGALISWRELQQRLDDTAATTYFYDVRLHSDFLRATYPFARSAPGGELVQSTDVFAPVRHARIVVADTELVQAPMTAHWLRQMGWQADVLEPATAPAPEPNAQARNPWLHTPQPVESVDPAQVCAYLDSPHVALIDCSSSLAFRRNHIPGAWYCARAALAAGLPALPNTVHTLIFTAEDSALAQFAAADAQALGWRVHVLAGGNRAWRGSGMPMARGAVRQLSEPNDVWYSPYEVEPHLQAAAMREYIAWEIGLAQRVASEPGLAFRVL